jgi:hypothetical protein
MRIGTKVKSRLSRKSCLHAAVIARGERTGHCLECGTAVVTPFTITGRRATARPAPCASPASCTMGQLITMADYRLPPWPEAPIDSTLDGAA